MFERKDTKAIKGLAIILMLFHHICGFPERFPVGFEGFYLYGNLWGGVVYCRSLLPLQGYACQFFSFWVDTVYINAWNRINLVCQIP